MAFDMRYNNYHIINRNLTNKWSTDYQQMPGIPYTFAFENALREIGDDLQELALTKWHYSFYISIVYLIVIFSLKIWMNTREAHSLRGCLTVWNIFLALFSIMGVIRCFPEFAHILINQGFKASYTKATYYNVSSSLFTNSYIVCQNFS